MPYYPNPAGGSMYAANESAARSQGWTPSMGTFGEYSTSESGPPPASGGSSTGTAPATVTTGTGGQQLATGINSLLGAIASGNKQAFDEAVRQFNATFGLDTQKFQEAVRQFNANLGVTEAGLTGQYQGSPTQQAALQQANIAAQQAGLTGYYRPSGTGQFVAKANGQIGQMMTDGSIQGYGSFGEFLANGGSQEAAQQALAYPMRDDMFDRATAMYASTAGSPTLAAQAQWANLYGANAAPTTGQETLASQLQTANILAQRNQTAQNWAQLYGYTPQVDANGNPVIVGAAGPGGQPATTLAAQQQQYAQQMGMINQAAQLQANPFRQQQAIGQMSRLLSGQGVAGFQAPSVVQGVGTAGGNTQGGMGYLQQMIDDIRDPAANAASMNQVMQGIPTPNKLNSVEFLRAAPSTQNMVLQGMQEKYGLDPTDALQQIKSTLPGFSAPTTFGSVKR
jgi:hypothetical protein